MQTQSRLRTGDATSRSGVTRTIVVEPVPRPRLETRADRKADLRALARMRRSMNGYIRSAAPHQRAAA
jgi:hypothetical protein